MREQPGARRGRWLAIVVAVPPFAIATMAVVLIALDRWSSFELTDGLAVLVLMGAVSGAVIAVGIADWVRWRAGHR